MAKARSYGRKHRRYAAPIGGLFVLLALIGLVVVVVYSVLLTGRVLDNSGEREKIEDIIRPMVMFDPVPFEKVTDIDSTQMLYYCMWTALINWDYGQNGGQGNTQEDNQMLVPASDLDVAAATLFGPDALLDHKTFGEYENTYYFDEEKQVYFVPTSAQLYTYSPQVELIERNGDFYDVMVGYVPPVGASPLTLRQGADPVPEKYMVYVMRKVESTYQVVAVRDAVVGETHMPNMR